MLKSTIIDRAWHATLMRLYSRDEIILISIGTIFTYPLNE